MPLNSESNKPTVCTITFSEVITGVDVFAGADNCTFCQTPSYGPAAPPKSGFNMDKIGPAFNVYIKNSDSIYNALYPYAMAPNKTMKQVSIGSWLNTDNGKFTLTSTICLETVHIANLTRSKEDNYISFDLLPEKVGNIDVTFDDENKTGDTKMNGRDYATGKEWLPKSAIKEKT